MQFLQYMGHGLVNIPSHRSQMPLSRGFQRFQMPLSRGLHQILTTQEPDQNIGFCLVQLTRSALFQGTPLKLIALIHLSTAMIPRRIFSRIFEALYSKNSHGAAIIAIVYSWAESCTEFYFRNAAQ